MKSQIPSFSKSVVLSKINLIESKVNATPFFFFCNFFPKIKKDLEQEINISSLFMQKREKMETSIHSISQQLNMYKHETAVLKETIKDSVWMLNKETSEALLKIKKPSQESQCIAENFLIILNQKEVSWKTFQVLP